MRAWLFDGRSTRSIDEEILDYNPSYSRGYQAMGILHHLGLQEPYKALFQGVSVDDAIEQLRAAGPQFRRVLEHLQVGGAEDAVALAKLQRVEAEELTRASADSGEARRRRIAEAPRKPPRIRVFSYAYKRNPDIVAEALARANGHCESCRLPAPFRRASDGSPYLEVHHRISLSDGGEDTLENVIAICPNCHRAIHHGQADTRQTQ